METTRYRIDNCLTQAKAIKEEYPNVAMLVFDIEDCPYNEMALIDEQRIKFVDGFAKADLHFYKSDGHPVTTIVSLISKKLLVTQTVTEE